MKSMTVVHALLVLALLAGCGNDIEPGRTEAEAPVIRGLELAKVTAAPVGEGATFVGTVESLQRGTLSARIDGRVGAVAVRVGDRVEAGDLLLTIEQNLAVARLGEAEAAEAEARRAQASASARRDLAEKTAQRFEQLFAEDAVTAQEMDRVRAELEVARQGLAAAQAAVSRAVSARAAAGTALSYSRVTAPYAATVSLRSVEEGSTVMPGTPLLVLDKAGGWQVRFRLPEALSGRIAPGDVVAVTVAALDQDLVGRVSEVAAAVDPRTRTFEAKIVIPQAPGLAPGMYAQVALSQPGAEAILVPRSALVLRGQLYGVYVVEAGRLSYRLVRTGRRMGERVEVLSGLAAGEVIVTGGAARAKNGARVEG